MRLLCMQCSLSCSPCSDWVIGLVSIFSSQKIVQRLVPQRLSGREHMFDPFQGLWPAAQTQKGLSLQVEQILLGDGGAGRHVTAGDHVCDYVSHLRLVFGGK